MPTPRFLCDRMFVRLGRYLRAAGYDTLIAADGAEDRALLAQARREHRLLVTGDRELALHARAPGHVLVLSSTGVASAAAELSRQVPIDWLAHSFTRCLLCNARLRRAPAGALERVPRESRQLAGELWECPACGRLYWEGSHVRRMRGCLRRWQEASPEVASSPS